MRRLTARRNAPLVAATALAVVLIALSCLGPRAALRLRRARLGGASADRRGHGGQTRPGTARRAHGQLARPEATARHRQQPSATVTATSRVRAIAADHKPAVNPHRQRRS